VDWGLAKAVGRDEARRLDSPEPTLHARAGEATPTQAGQVIGTPAYMSPEQARGKSGAADGRADQFALASMVYEMLSGKPAFARDGDELWTILTFVLGLSLRLLAIRYKWEMPKFVFNSERP